MLRLHKEQKKRAERESRERRNRDQDYRDREPENENNGDISMHRLADKRKSARKVEDFGGNTVSADDKDALKSELTKDVPFSGYA